MINDIVLSDMFIEGMLPNGVADNTTVFNKNKKVRDVVITRSLISRDCETNNVVNNVIGSYVKDNEFYISSELLGKDELEKIIKLMLEIGIGKWRNVGKGRYKLKSIEEFVPETDVKKFVALGNFIPNDEDLLDIENVGYTVRNATATNGKRQKPVAMLLTGTTFKSVKQIVGKHIFDENSETYIHGKSIVIGV
jgi:CRISPR type III-A-associated RAMP protein Csm4